MTKLGPRQLAELAEQALRDQEEERAAVLLGHWLSDHKPDARVLQWHALLLRALDSRREAIVQIDHAASLLPLDPVIALTAAQIRLEAGLPSSPQFESALRLAPTSSDARTGLIAAYFAERNGDQALAMLEGALASNPGWQEGYRQYAQLATLLGRAQQALDPLMRTLNSYPDALALHVDLIEMMMAAGRYDAAIRQCQKAEARLGAVPDLMWRRAASLDERGRTDEAAQIYASLGAPEDSVQTSRVMRHLLRRGLAQAALDIAQPWLSSGYATEVWPYVSLAWRMLSHPSSDWFEGPPGLIGIYDLGEGLDWPALAARLRAIHAMSGQFSNQSVNGGTQTDGPLFARIEPEIVAVRQIVMQALQDHVAALPPEVAGHPQLGLSRHHPLRFSGSWSVRFEGRGFHRAHHHPQGWFSGVLYVSVPDSLQKNEGQLSLGQSPPELGLGLVPSRYVEPVPGRLVVFPSTMWHATEPFADGERMTIAFDLARNANEATK